MDSTRNLFSTLTLKYQRKNTSVMVHCLIRYNDSYHLSGLMFGFRKRLCGCVNFWPQLMIHWNRTRLSVMRIEGELLWSCVPNRHSSHVDLTPLSIFIFILSQHHWQWAQSSFTPSPINPRLWMPPQLSTFPGSAAKIPPLGIWLEDFCHWDGWRSDVWDA